MYRYKELINQYKDEHGILPAKRMARKQRIKELLDEVSSLSSNNDGVNSGVYANVRIDRLTKVLYLMNEEQ